MIWLCAYIKQHKTLRIGIQFCWVI